MPYLEPANMALPFASGSDTSRAGAAQPHAGRQRDELEAWYRRAPFSGFTDAEIAEKTGYPVNIITARRSDLGCVPCGKRMGPHNVSVTARVLPTEATT